MSSSPSRPVGRILISNDDGIDAIGIGILCDIASKLSDDIWVIAPDGNRSGMSRAITLHRDVIIEPQGNNRFSCSGTPSDCVIMGMARVLDRKPDLVLSGINAGMNAADDVLYSGTIAAAMEASLMGVPAIALSQRNGRLARDDYAAAIAHGETVIRHILAHGIAPRTIMNVNFPPVPPERVKGIMPASLDNHKFGDQVIDGDGPNSYRLGPLLARDETIAGSDRAVMDEGWISLTALGMDITASTVQAGLARVDF
ncbi:MAG: 5'/3'-nucleotidase SurE [Candidatus Puniceispirillaceae bacterium]